MSRLRSRLEVVRRQLVSDTAAQERLEDLAFAVGALQAREARRADTMQEAEFRCFSQFGEDGIIQWLLARVPIEEESFAELGVGDYRESNTRFLLEHDDWRGRIVDSGDAHVAYVHSRELAWRYSIDAQIDFITRDNVDELLSGLPPDLGLLSIDLDGMDYWIWEAVSVVAPRIVIVEYNSVFGRDRAVVVPYAPDFDRSRAHPSWLYWGASLAALGALGQRKGYRLAGSNRTGHNAFFVREDMAGSIPPTTPVEAWRESRYRESRGADGSLTYVDAHSDRRALMADMPLIDVETGESLRVGDLEAAPSE